MSNYTRHRPWSMEAAERLLDMSGGLSEFQELGKEQLKAALALHRMLLLQGCAYLADEVGMGKTYVALAVIALFRHIDPSFRVLYITPSRNVMEKWHGRELPAFLGGNIRIPYAQQFPGAPSSALACGSVDEWIRCVRQKEPPNDTFLSFTSFSFPLSGHKDDWQGRVKGLAIVAGTSLNLAGVEKKETFKQRAAEIVNAVLPTYDLVVIDEAHLLKNDASDRARFLSTVLGTDGQGSVRLRGALLLSGTPYDRDLSQLARQLKMVSPSKSRNSPYQRVEELILKRQNGYDWSVVHKGLKSLIVRRVQTLKVGDRRLSRNQYRLEHRSTAGITLTANDPATLQQRLFTAMVQKRLIEHLDNSNAGRFPTAMFASWEAYSSASRRALPSKMEKAKDDLVEGDVLDNDEKGSPRENALDSSLMKNIVESHEAVFQIPPPHPKLDNEVRRLAEEALQRGEKQLVFVRRLKSVDDLYLRLNRAYDEWLADYLEGHGLLSANIWVEQSLIIRRESSPPTSSATESVGFEPEGKDRKGEEEEDIPVSRETLFSWFFCGKLTTDGIDFASRHKLPLPSVLRARLRDPDRQESLIAEIDWRWLLSAEGYVSCYVSIDEIVEQAANDGSQGASTRLNRYRRLQMAWANCAASKCDGGVKSALAHIADYLLFLVKSTPVGSVKDEIKLKEARELLSSPTLYQGLAEAGSLTQILPGWATAWCKLITSDTLAGQHLQRLDLHRELIFALLRLNHPFIDLYICWTRSHNRETAGLAAQDLVDCVVASCRGLSKRLDTGNILRLLADAFDHVVKTNFAPLVEAQGRIPRSEWRNYIRQQLVPISPIEWVSGDKSSDNRSPIARRFRMPGYPVVLVATSVMQEGEDLHVCCDRVTHFGISGSPIGIEQKNGRVDRIGSMAHRRLQRLKSVEQAGIRVHFPHLTESMEWYQIRDLAINLNEHWRSMHKFDGASPEEVPVLGEVIADRRPIPEQLQERLYSPFEPEVFEGEVGCVRLEDM